MKGLVKEYIDHDYSRSFETCAFRRIIADMHKDKKPANQRRWEKYFWIALLIVMFIGIEIASYLSLGRLRRLRVYRWPLKS